MKTEYRLAECLRNLMSTTPLDTISVTTLTKNCKINRQTFYYHFHDIYDLLTLVYLNEKIKGIEETTNVKEMVKVIFEYYNENKFFIDASLSSAGKSLVQEFIYNNCYKSIYRFIGETTSGKKMHHTDKKIITRFYAMAYANSIVYYLSTYKNKTLQGLKQCFCFESDDFLEKAAINFNKNKNKK